MNALYIIPAMLALLACACFYLAGYAAAMDHVTRRTRK